MPSPWYPFVVSDYVIGKVISFEEWRGAIENPKAIAEGAVGAPRVVVPTALSTAETDTAKRLHPNGSGGVQWVSPSGSFGLIQSGGSMTIDTGAWAVHYFSQNGSGDATGLFSGGGTSIHRTVSGHATINAGAFTAHHGKESSLTVIIVTSSGGVPGDNGASSIGAEAAFTNPLSIAGTTLSLGGSGLFAQAWKIG